MTQYQKRIYPLVQIRASLDGWISRLAASKPKPKMKYPRHKGVA